MNTFTLHLRVLDANKKSKFSHYHLSDVPKFQYPEELKSYLVDKHSAVIAPATTLNFTMGYIVEGKGNQEYNIIDSATLQQAYDSATSGRVCLWVDPHVPEVSKKAAKRSLTSADTAKDIADDSKKQRREVVFEDLKSRHGDKWPEFKLRCWATMVSAGSHTSVDVPPNVAFFKNTCTSSTATTTKTEVNTTTKISENRGALLKQLKDLSELRKDGVLNASDFDIQKAKILKELTSL